MNILQELEELPPGTLDAVMGVAIAVGTLYCFLGYRTLKIVIGLTGFALAGGAAGALAGWLTQGHTLATLGAGAAGGIAGAMALFFVYRAGVFVMGLVAAAIIALNAFGGLEEAWAPWAIAGTGLAGGAVALLLERPILTLATAAIGAWVLVCGLAYFILGPPPVRLAGHPMELAGTDGALIFGWIVLAAGGALMQFATHRRGGGVPGAGRGR